MHKIKGKNDGKNIEEMVSDPYQTQRVPYHQHRIWLHRVGEGDELLRVYPGGD